MPQREDLLTGTEAEQNGVGTRLRIVRLDRELSIEETAWRTRIRPELLRALEEDEFDQIGHRAFVRSHLSSYARFLGVDPAEVLEEYESRQHDPEPSALGELERRRRTSRKPPRAKWLVAAALSAIVITLAAIVGVLGGQAERPSGDVEQVAALPPDDGLVPAVLARVRIQIEATEATQVTVLADGEEIFDGMLTPGDVRVFRARTAIELRGANGGTILLSVNGDEVAVAGVEGSVFRARFGPRGRLDTE